MQYGLLEEKKNHKKKSMWYKQYEKNEDLCNSFL